MHVQDNVLESHVHMQETGKCFETTVLVHAEVRLNRFVIVKTLSTHHSLCLIYVWCMHIVEWCVINTTMAFSLQLRPSENCNRVHQLTTNSLKACVQSDGTCTYGYQCSVSGTSRSNPVSERGDSEHGKRMGASSSSFSAAMSRKHCQVEKENIVMRCYKLICIPTRTSFKSTWVRQFIHWMIPDGWFLLRKKGGMIKFYPQFLLHNYRTAR